MVEQGDEREADQEEGDHEEAPENTRAEPSIPGQRRTFWGTLEEVADHLQVARGSPVGDVVPEELAPVVFWGGVVEDAGEQGDKIAAKAHGRHDRGHH